MMESEREDQAGKNAADTEDAGIGWLTGLAFVALLAAVAWAFYDFRLPAPGGTSIVGYLCTAALVCLLMQMAVGFPAETAIENEVAKSVRKEKVDAAAAQASSRINLQYNTGLTGFDQSMREARIAAQNAGDAVNKGLGTAMAMAFTVDLQFGFYLQLLVLSIPAALRLRSFMVEKQPLPPPTPVRLASTLGQGYPFQKP